MISTRGQYPIVYLVIVLECMWQLNLDEGLCEGIIEERCIGISNTNAKAEQSRECIKCAELS